MKISLLLAVASVLTIATSALAVGPVFDGYHIEGYLDRAPEGSRVAETIQLRDAAGSRTLLIVRRDELGGPSLSSAANQLHRRFFPFHLSGDRDRIASLMASPTGAHVRAFFIEARAYPTIFVGEFAPDESRQEIGQTESVGHQG